MTEATDYLEFSPSSCGKDENSKFYRGLKSNNSQVNGDNRAGNFVSVWE